MRITPAELSALAAAETVRESLKIGAGEWGAEIRQGERTQLTMNGAVIAIELAPLDLAALLNPESEGVYLREEAAGLGYIIEKDFPCAHPRAVDAHEPATETFAAPEGFTQRKLSSGC
jgi:hypothetical protein